jgi:diguanylate cyclase (GGDEF)-like protein
VTSKQRPIPRRATRYTGHLSDADAEALYQLAVTDSLTGCYNRRFFEDVIVHELDRHHRYDMPLSILFVDIDHLKQVNDTRGHGTGDRVLVQVAQFLTQSVRESDYVFRWGGDEFLILTACIGEHANQKARQLKAAFTGATFSDEVPQGMGLSIGCAEFGRDGDDPDVVIRVADQRMYEDKRRAPGNRATE